MEGTQVEGTQVEGTQDKLTRELNRAMTPVPSYLFMGPMKEGSGRSRRRSWHMQSTQSHQPTRQTPFLHLLLRKQEEVRRQLKLPPQGEARWGSELPFPVGRARRQNFTFHSRTALFQRATCDVRRLKTLRGRCRICV